MDRPLRRVCGQVLIRPWRRVRGAILYLQRLDTHIVPSCEDEGTTAAGGEHSRSARLGSMLPLVEEGNTDENASPTDDAVASPESPGEGRHEEAHDTAAARVQAAMRGRLSRKELLAASRKAELSLAERGELHEDEEWEASDAPGSDGPQVENPSRHAVTFRDMSLRVVTVVTFCRLRIRRAGC